MSKLLMGTNLKMYKGIAQTREYLLRLRELTADLAGKATIFVIPSYTSLETARRAVPDHGIMLGAQNVCPAEEGQFTGEISPLMLRELKMELVMIGHSERRHIYGETDEEEKAKVISVLKHGFTALLCIGETAEQKESGISDEMLSVQLKITLRGVTHAYVDRVWIAYEPVWAIGAGGVPAEPEYVEQRHGAIRRVLSDLLPGAHIPILYGGSVNPRNAEGILALENVDGLFTGRAAWDAGKFDNLIRQVLPVWESKQRNAVCGG